MRRRFTFLLFLMFALLMTGTVSYGQTPGAKKPKKIPDVYLAESMDVFEYCNRTDSMRRNYDCECFASKFLDLRIQKGASENKESLSLQLQGECRDTTEASSYSYNNCLAGVGTMPPGTDPEAFCTCVGNTYAQLLDRDKPVMSQQTIIDYQTQALQICSNPNTQY